MPRLAELEVWNQGDELNSGILARGGTVETNVSQPLAFSKFFDGKIKNQCYENVFLLLARRRRKFLLFRAVLQRFSFIFYHFRVNFPAQSQKIYYGPPTFTIGRISLQ